MFNYFFITSTMVSTQRIGSPNTSNTADLKTSTNLRRKLSLRATQDNVQEFLAGGHRCDLIER